MDLSDLTFQPSSHIAKMITSPLVLTVPFPERTKKLWWFEIEHFSLCFLLPRSCVIHWRREGAAQEVHQPLVPAGQDVPSPSVAEPGGRPTGLLLWSALDGGRAHCEWARMCVCLSVSKCVKRLLLWAALSLGWQSPRSSNPLDPPSISFRALRDYPQICELSPGRFVSPLRGSGTKARWTWPMLLLKTVCHTFYLKRRQRYLIQKNLRGDKICYMWAAFLYSTL